MLEPPGYSVPACGSLNGCARGDVAEHADGFIERRAVLTVEHGMDERGCNLWRNGGCRFGRSEEHTSELQSLMRISYAVFCLKKKNEIQYKINIKNHYRYSNLNS